MANTAHELRTALEAQREVLFDQDFEAYLPPEIVMKGAKESEEGNAWFSLIVRDISVLRVFVTGSEVRIDIADGFESVETEMLTLLNRAVTDRIRARHDATFAAVPVERFEQAFADIRVAATAGTARARLAEKLLMDVWDHDRGAHRIEELAAHNPEFGEMLPGLALRFISEKGLSDEFADVMEDAEARTTEPSNDVSGGFEP